jgi:hypothetical protein
MDMLKNTDSTEGTSEMTKEQYPFECFDCRQVYYVTESQFAANGWKTHDDIVHVGCPKPSHYDPYDWSQATDADHREMEAQARGDENVRG